MVVVFVVFCLRLNALLCTSVREIICLSDQEGQPVSWPKKQKTIVGPRDPWGNPGGVGIGYLTLLSVWEGLLEKGG